VAALTLWRREISAMVASSESSDNTATSFCSAGGATGFRLLTPPSSSPGQHPRTLKENSSH
jgi:hypothetical protein